MVQNLLSQPWTEHDLLPIVKNLCEPQSELVKP